MIKDKNLNLNACKWFKIKGRNKIKSWKRLSETKFKLKCRQSFHGQTYPYPVKWTTDIFNVLEWGTARDHTKKLLNKRSILNPSDPVSFIKNPINKRETRIQDQSQPDLNGCDKYHHRYSVTNADKSTETPCNFWQPFMHLSWNRQRFCDGYSRSYNFAVTSHNFKTVIKETTNCRTVAQFTKQRMSHVWHCQSVLKHTYPWFI